MNTLAKKAPARSTERDEIRSIENSLKLMHERLVSALPPHITARSFVSTVLTACSIEPKLLACDRHSLFLACMKSARDGLLPDGREAALVPFWDTKRKAHLAVYIAMYQGMLKKIRNSGELASLAANVVYENDAFEYELGDNEHITHKPVFNGPRGAMIGAYAIAKTKDGGIYRRVLTGEEIKKIKAFSKAEHGPWQGDFESEMWIKSAIRRLSKILPQSTDLNQYLASGPPLPVDEAGSVLPDSTGTEGLESVEWDLRTRALLSLKDEAPDLATLQGVWDGVKMEYAKIQTEVPLEVEEVFQRKQEHFKAALAEGARP